ncbi:MAG: hypothetical protein ACP5JG_14615 [Anaerolineae bacterium]
MSKRRKRRFPLLPYRLVTQNWRGPALLLVPAGVALYWIASRTEQLNQTYAPLAFTVSLVGVLLYAYTLLARRAHISLEYNRFVVHTPFLPVAFSYRRVGVVRTVEFATLFPPDEMKPAQWRTYQGLMGRTVPVIPLEGYPLPYGWLRLWFHSFLFHPKETALVVPVDDWMGFIRNLETLRTIWRDERRQ